MGNIIYEKMKLREGRFHMLLGRGAEPFHAVCHIGGNIIVGRKNIRRCIVDEKIRLNGFRTIGTQKHLEHPCMGEHEHGMISLRFP